MDFLQSFLIWKVIAGPNSTPLVITPRSPSMFHKFGFYQFEKQYFLDHFNLIAISGGFYFSVFIISLIKFGKPINFHTYAAKITAVFLVIFLAYTLFFGGNDLLFYIAFVLTVIETIEEILIIRMINDWNANIPGIWVVIKNKKMDKK